MKQRIEVSKVYCPSCHLQVALVGIQTSKCTNCNARLNRQTGRQANKFLPRFEHRMPAVRHA
jgi:transposase-like protein